MRSKIQKILSLLAMIFSVFLVIGTSTFAPFVPELTHYASAASNTNFGSTMKLSAALPNQSPKIAISGTSNILVVWESLTSSQYDIYLKRSTDTGATFSTSAVNIPSTSTSSTSPKIAVSGSNVYVVWTEAVSSGNNEI